MHLPRRGAGERCGPAERPGPYADNHGITMANAAVASRTGGIVAEPRRAQLDLLEQVRATRLPFAELLGIEFVSASPENIVGKMTVREDLCTRPAVLHGGAIMAFADT